MDSNAHLRVFRKAIKANGEKMDVKIINLFCFTLSHIQVGRKNYASASNLQIWGARS
jgi:hypothetical protein